MSYSICIQFWFAVSLSIEKPDTQASPQFIKQLTYFD